MQSAPTDPWNSLEVVKVVVSLLTPVFVFLLAVYAGHLASRLENARWTNQKLLERRLDIYDRLAPLLHEYFRRIKSNRVGLVDVRGMKQLREEFDGSRHLFSEEVGRAFDSYVNSGTMHFEAAVHKPGDESLERLRDQALDADERLLEVLHDDVGWPRHKRRIGYRPRNVRPD